MIETSALILRVESEFAWVEVRPHTPCGMCDPEKGCRSLTISRMFASKDQSFCVRNSINAQEGDWVSISVPDRWIFHSAVLLYLLPLLGLFLGALIGAIWGEVLSVIGAFVSMMFVFCIIHFWSRAKREQSLPQIIAKIDINTLSREKKCHSKKSL